jgi:FemAB-related protein (PEP-CTERM system-associated)
MKLTVSSHPAPDWDTFVRAQPQAHVYLLSGWALLAHEVFGHDVFFIEARDASGALCGVLSLARQKSLVFGNFMTSLPFFNYGGALATTEATTLLLMERARDVASELGCSYLEFRDSEPRPGAWQVRMDKVSMILKLPADTAALAKQLGAKLRSQVKRAERENPSVRTGGRELLTDFYDVFCRTMRDLGTPVYPVRFFEALLRSFPNECRLVIVDREGKPAAAGFLIFANGRAEIPWAGCRDDAKAAGFNMRLYWEVLAESVKHGCQQFDFGRSTADSGTYRFKKQWGAEPLQLYWHRWERNPDLQHGTAPAKDGALMRYATTVWQRLPLGVANRLGPLVSPSLPW